jgi:hypothetical protein
VFLSTINTQPSTGLANISVKEKDEASLSDDFRQDSLDAFIPRFAGIEGFFIFEIFKFRAGLSIANPFPDFFAELN